MADYIYLLESRLSPAQQRAIQTVREIARSKGLTIFLVGGAVRDLTSGYPVRDLDVVVQGNALKLNKTLEKAGAEISGEHELLQSLYVRFPGNVRIEVASTLLVSYPKPGKPVVKPAAILEDLRRRDFTANAMALSLNEGSYGLLMDPLNGVADIENRELRLVSNYGFIEDPVRMIRAARLGARLGWQMEERTRTRYETGKSEGYISAMSEFQRGYELEEIVHEEDPLRVMKRLEADGWMKVLSPVWNTSKANAGELEKLKDAQAQLQGQGVAADASAAQFPLLTAKLQPKDVSGLKKAFPRKGFVAEIDGLEGEAKHFAAELQSKAATTASATYKMILAAKPEVALWTAYSAKTAALKTKFASFYTEWPQARLRIPYALMQEMRIVPELAGFDELSEKLFFELMDGKLTTPEEMKAYLEPHSPPAPPPPPSMRRARVARKETAKAAKARKKAESAARDSAAAEIASEVIAELHGEGQAATHAGEVVVVPAKAVATKTVPVKVAAVSAKAAVKKVEATAKAPAKKAVAVKVAVAKKTAQPVKKAVAKKAPAKVVVKKAAKPVQKAPAKKPAVKPVAKKAPAKKPMKVVKAPAKKIVKKAAKRR